MTTASRGALLPTISEGPRDMRQVWLNRLDRGGIPEMPPSDLPGLSSEAKSVIGTVNKLAEMLTANKQNIAATEAELKVATSSRPETLRLAALNGTEPPDDPLPQLQAKLTRLDSEQQGITLAVRQEVLDAYNALAACTDDVIAEANREIERVAANTLTALGAMGGLIGKMNRPLAAIQWAGGGNPSSFFAEVTPEVLTDLDAMKAKLTALANVGADNGGDDE